MAATAGSIILNVGTEYNPTDASLHQISGTHTNGDSSLILRINGTYSSQNLDGLNSGTWSHFDWNLTFSDSPLKQARWIKFRHKPAILPYFSGPDGSDGLILKKQSK